ncbi:hypothetical protein GCM10010383_39030 [Streptomyces lomondensis]|uniref:Uncharacterized protein n=1 Tax=Streptomyces lomondensis TaxID=68229 RepID=A0ABQ2X9B3_9ACTN|nr:hypothetical protein GCM10010383_39030 [Streptomyces lomondensis]
MPVRGNGLLVATSWQEKAGAGQVTWGIGVLLGCPGPIRVPSHESEVFMEIDY